MKITPYDPKSACTNNLDSSRLGFHAKSHSLESLVDAPHGIVLVGFADDTGIKNVGGRPGAKAGPRAAREKLYKFTTGATKIPLYDLGDLETLGSIEETHRAGAEIVRRIHGSGHLPLVIGGGHDLAYPEALGLLESRPNQRLGFLNIDAHLDLRSVTNGITSGSPWFLLREHPAFQKSRSRIEEFGIQTHCNAPMLVDYARRHGIGIQWLHEIKNVEKAFLKTLNSFRTFAKIQVSLDIDSVRWSEAPGASAPQTLGFRASEAIAMSRMAGMFPKTASFGIYELSPPLDPDGRTAALVAHCILGFLEGYGKKKRAR